MSVLMFPSNWVVFLVGVCVIRQAPVMCVMAPPIHLSVALIMLLFEFLVWCVVTPAVCVAQCFVCLQLVHQSPAVGMFLMRM